jgi:hypothetical protein
MYERVLQHRGMLKDAVRMQAYRKAIHEAVNPGDVVVDIGTGSGVLAMFSLQAGAKKVYAIEQGDVIADAKKLAEKNGVSDKITFIQNRSDKVELPERADVVTSELIGYFGLEENLNRFQIDARKRFLKPDGKLVPSWLELCLAPVESKKIYEDHPGLWSKDFYGLDFSPVLEYALSNTYLTDCCGKAKMLSEPAVIQHIDFYKAEKIPRTFHAEFEVGSEGVLHGLVGYFRAGLFNEVVLNTSPEEPVTHWMQTFMPADEPTAVSPGDTMQCRIKSLLHSDIVYWQWETELDRKGRGITKFNRCNLNLLKREIMVGKESFLPVLTPDGAVRRKIFELCDGKTSMSRIGQELCELYPDKFADHKQAMKEAVTVLRDFVNI